MSRRVVITGMGTVNPLSDNLEDYYNKLIKGQSGIRVWKSLDMTDVENKVGGDLGDYDFTLSLERFKDDIEESRFKKIKKLFKFTTFSAKMATITALSAYKDAGLLDKQVDPYRTSIIMAGHNFNSNYIFANGLDFLKEPEFMTAMAGVEGTDQNVPAIVSEVLQLQGPTFTIGGACASGNLALRDGMRDIILGECDRAIVAGAPFDVSAADIQASVIIQSVVVKSEYQEQPEKASRPFDLNRCGFVYSHGAGTVVLESLESALDRGATIYGELLGVKASANANHLPMPGAEKQVRVMNELLKNCNVYPEQVDYANCHATGTPAGDLQEIKAIKGAFGEHSKKMYLNAPKSMLGHTCWSSPLVEMIGGLLQIKHGKLHPTINVDDLDSEIDLNICADGAVDHQINYMLKNSFGFGGINCVALLKRYEK